MWMTQMYNFGHIVGGDISTYVFLSTARFNLLLSTDAYVPKSPCWWIVSTEIRFCLTSDCHCSLNLNSMVASCHFKIIRQSYNEAWVCAGGYKHSLPRQPQGQSRVCYQEGGCHPNSMEKYVLNSSLLIYTSAAFEPWEAVPVLSWQVVYVTPQQNTFGSSHYIGLGGGPQGSERDSQSCLMTLPPSDTCVVPGGSAQSEEKQLIIHSLQWAYSCTVW